MDSVEKLIELLKKDEYREIIAEIYSSLKVSLRQEWQEIDDNTMISYIQAYCINVFNNIKNKRTKDLFIESLKVGFPFVVIIESFIDEMNAINATIAEPINKDAIEDLKILVQHRKDAMFKELSKSNKEIARIIKDYHGFETIDGIKKGKYKRKYGYEITKEEIETIEKVKQIGNLNQIAHTLYDRKDLFHYVCDHEVKKEDDILKHFMITTNRNNPEYNIIFRDGTIINYYNGEIRKKPYDFKQIVFFTKLFYCAHYKVMKSYYDNCYNITDDDDYVSSDVGIHMVISSSINVMIILHALEEIYTKRMIDDSNETFEKIKKIAKDYSL